MSFFTHNIFLYLSGIRTTLLLTFGSAFLGLVLAFFISYVNIKKIPVFFQLAQCYIFLIRGTPFLLQLFIIYYGLIGFSWIAHSPFHLFFESPYHCALVALTINTCAYTTVFITQAYQAINVKEILVAELLGFSNLAILRYFKLPKMMVETLPLYRNELIMLVKCSAITSSITINDVMGVTQQMIGLTYKTMPFLVMAGIIYLFINCTIAIPIQIIYRAYIRKLNKA